MSSTMAPFADVESNGSKMKSSEKSAKEKHLIAAVVILAIVLFAFVIAVIALAIKDVKHKAHDDVCQTPGCLSTALEMLYSMNTSVDPCDDFYEFACGNWHTSPTAFGNDRYTMVTINNLFDTSDHIISAARDESLPKSVKEIAKAYVLCGNYGDLRNDDIPWLFDTLESVGGWPMADSEWKEIQYPWERNLALAIHHLNLETPLAIGVESNYFDSTKYVIHIHQHVIEALPILEKERILSIAKRIGSRDDDSSLEREYQEMEKFADHLRKMSGAQHDILKVPNEFKELTIKELQKQIPWINWLEFLNAIFKPHLRFPFRDSEPVIVFGFTYVSKFLESAFNETVSRRTLANYIAASFIQHLISINDKFALPSSLVAAKNHGNVHVPMGFSEQCLGFFSLKGSYAVDFIHHKYRKEKLVDKKMIDYFLKGMKDIINNAAWLDEVTRKAADEKLEAIVAFSGYPEIVKDGKKVDEFYRGLPNMTENSLRNQLEIERHFFMRHAELLREKVDRHKWPLAERTQASQTNALNGFDLNIIVIPAGIQSKPLYSPDSPNYWNFGCFGWIIAHEITHSFDTTGSTRDKYGNFRNWWMPKAKAEFEKQSKCFIEQYDKFDLGYEGHHVNGTSTVGENVADNGGLHQAFLAYLKWEKENGKEKRLPGLEEYTPHQLFYIAANQFYCSKPIPPEELYKVASMDVHSPGKFRFNGAAVNSKEFAETFKCKPGSRMNPVKKCVIW